MSMENNIMPCYTPGNVVQCSNNSSGPYPTQSDNNNSTPPSTVNNNAISPPPSATPSAGYSRVVETPVSMPMSSMSMSIGQQPLQPLPPQLSQPPMPPSAAFGQNMYSNGGHNNSSPYLHHHPHHYQSFPPPPPAQMVMMSNGPMPVSHSLPRPPMISHMQPDHRIHDLNKRLQYRPEENDILWWDTFAAEFFEDDATLTLHCNMDDGPKRYTISRVLIPRYFRTIFDSGCCELYYVLRCPRFNFHHSHIIVDSDAMDMVMKMTRPFPTSVIAEGRIILEFACDEFMRIRNWIFFVRGHRELVFRSMLGIPDPMLLENITKNITRNGMTHQIMNFLHLSLILEPMQELMSRQKAYSLTPRECLKTTLFQKWQRMVAPPDNHRPPSKPRRKRKPNNSGSSESNTTNVTHRNGKRKLSPNSMQSITTTPGDVMVVGEPSLMGGNFGDEDERMITRLENAHFVSCQSQSEGGDTSSSSHGGGTAGGGGGMHNNCGSMFMVNSRLSTINRSSSNGGQMHNNNNNNINLINSSSSSTGHHCETDMDLRSSESLTTTTFNDAGDNGNNCNAHLVSSASMTIDNVGNTTSATNISHKTTTTTTTPTSQQQQQQQQNKQTTTTTTSRGVTGTPMYKLMAMERLYGTTGRSHNNTADSVSQRQTSPTKPSSKPPPQPPRQSPQLQPQPQPSLQSITTVHHDSLSTSSPGNLGNNNLTTT